MTQLDRDDFLKDSNMSLLRLKQIENYTQKKLNIFNQNKDVLLEYLGETNFSKLEEMLRIEETFTKRILAIKRELDNRENI